MSRLSLAVMGILSVTYGVDLQSTVESRKSAHKSHVLKQYQPSIKDEPKIAVFDDSLLDLLTQYSIDEKRERSEGRLLQSTLMDDAEETQDFDALEIEEESEKAKEPQE